MTLIPVEPSQRVPTYNQYVRLRALADPGRLLVSGIGGDRRVWRSLLKHGWVEPENPGRNPENGLRITPSGLRALAAHLEQHDLRGLPALAARASCGRRS